MEKKSQRYHSELQKIYDQYEKKIINAKTIENILEIGVQIQKKMGALNIKYRLWNSSKGYDHDAIYYTASFIVENCMMPEILQLDVQNAQNRKERLSEILFQVIDERAKKRIHAIEPHPDDLLGSASGLCYSEGASVTLHTISQVEDERDFVNWEQDMNSIYKNIRKKPNITRHYKYEDPDLHWDNRNLNLEVDYDVLLKEYIQMYGEESVRRLLTHIEHIIRLAIDEKAYIAFPLGIEHPMHMLVTYACVNQIKEQGFNQEKVIIYVDHPYDYQNAGLGRLQKARDYIQAELGMRLIRCDDLSVDQSVLEGIITEIYGANHYGEFDGSLENTFCSYFIDYMALETISQFLKIHVNNVLYITAQAKPYYKTGGLGEVAYVYCKALKDFVNDVRIMMPKYSGEDIKEDIEDTEQAVYDFEYKGSTQDIGNFLCRIEKRLYHDLVFYLIDIKDYFVGRNSFDSGNHGKVFSIFCDAIMQKGLSTIDYIPSVLHCNDWQTALIPMLKKTKYEYFRPELKVIYTIHFYGYKGIFKKSRILEYVGLDKSKCRLCVACGDDCPLNRIDLLSNEDLGKLNVTPSQMSFDALKSFDSRARISLEGLFTDESEYSYKMDDTQYPLYMVLYLPHKGTEELERIKEYTSNRAVTSKQEQKWWEGQAKLIAKLIDLRDYISYTIKNIDTDFGEICQYIDADSCKNVRRELCNIIMVILDLVRFLIKSDYYRDEREYRIIQYSSDPEYDDTGEGMPKLYIPVEKEFKYEKICFGPLVQNFDSQAAYVMNIKKEKEAGEPRKTWKLEVCKSDIEYR